MSLDGKSSLYFERGFNPITPIDVIGNLPVKIKDDCPTGVLARAQHLDAMRKAALDAIYEADKNYDYYYNLKRSNSDHITVGSLVRLKLDHINLPIFKHRPRNKLNPIWFGPFRVIGQPSTVSYELELPQDVTIHPVFHVSKLKPATDSSFSKLRPIVIPTDESQEGEYEVESILDHQWDVKSKRWFYLVQWKGYSPLFHATWEPRQHLDSAKHLRDEYDRKHDLHDHPSRS